MDDMKIVEEIGNLKIQIKGVESRALSNEKSIDDSIEDDKCFRVEVRKELDEVKEQIKITYKLDKSLELLNQTMVSMNKEMTEVKQSQKETQVQFSTDVKKINEKLDKIERTPGESAQRTISVIKEKFIIVFFTMLITYAIIQVFPFLK